jgi:hypothetical protein
MKMVVLKTHNKRTKCSSSVQRLWTSTSEIPVIQTGDSGQFSGLTNFEKPAKVPHLFYGVPDSRPGTFLKFPIIALWKLRSPLVGDSGQVSGVSEL